LAADWDLIFAARPPPWGLRGDPLLWDELAASLRGTALPRNAADRQAMLETAWTALTGHPVNTDIATIQLDRLDCGGQSGGLVSPGFWRETAFPLLLARLSSIRET